MAENKSTKTKQKSLTASNEGGILAGLWDTIYKSTGAVNSVKYLTDEYTKRHYSNSLINNKPKTRARNTLLSNLNAPTMTWKVFMDLVFNFLNVRKITIVIKLTHNDMSETIHSTTRLNPTLKKKSDVVMSKKEKGAKDE